MSHLERLTIASLALACTWLVAISASASEAERYTIDARIDASSGSIDASIAIDVSVGPEEDAIRLWLYADRLAVSPSSMDERSWRWIYPGEVDQGGIALTSVAIDGHAADLTITSEPVGERRGRDFAGSDALVAIAPGGARTVHLTFEMHLDVPDRFGRLGRDGHTISLAAPWYPLVIDGDAWEHDVPQSLHAVVTNGVIRTRLAGGTTIDTSETTSFVPALVVAGAIHERTVDVNGHRLTYVSSDPIYTPPPASARGLEGLADITGIDRVRLISEAYADVTTTASWLGLPIPDELVVLAVHSRTELAASAPNVALVSDRIFEIFPLDVVQEFHRRAVRRALFATILQPLSAAHEDDVDHGWVDDLRSAALVDLDELRRNNNAQTPQQLLQLFAFHPAVDQLLYAPQISFEDSYFGAVDEPDRFRDDPVRARFPNTRGRRLLECVRDVLDEQSMERFVAMLARGRRSIREALERVGVDVEARLPEWLRYATLETNYALGAIHTERTDTGFRTTVEVLRQGDERPEPVEVQVEDGAGNRVSAFWDGRGERGTVVIDTPADRSSVTIDPQQRLPQSATVADGHPRQDDATNAPWRPPIFTAFSLTLLASQGDINGLIDVALRQRYDLEHTVALRLSRTGARTGGRIFYIQGLGPKAHTNRRIGSFGGGIGFNYVSPNFGGSGNQGGYELSLQVSGGVDTRRFLYDPRDAFLLQAALQAGGVFRDDGNFGVNARGSLIAAWIVPVGLLNTFVFAGGAGFTANPILLADRQAIGGQYALRAFANDELLGNGAVYGVIEHRVTVASDLNLNVLWGVFARELQLVWWVGGGAVFDTIDRRGMQHDVHGAFEAGGGIRVHYEYGGIAPGVLAIDIGAPISRWAEQGCAFCGPYPAVGFYVGFDQYY